MRQLVTVMKDNVPICSIKKAKESEKQKAVFENLQIATVSKP